MRLREFTRQPSGCSASGELDMHPTYFETVTAMAFVLFADAKLDMVVLEVGLGGTSGRDQRGDSRRFA